MNADPRRVLLVDDDASVRFGVRNYLEARGFAVHEAADCHSAEQCYRSSMPDIAIVDFELPDGDALSLLPRLKSIDPSVAMVVLTGHGSIDLAVRAVKAGAEQFLTKPVDLGALEAIMRRQLDQQRNHKQRLAARKRDAREVVDPFIGTSPAIQHLAKQARRIVAAASPILIQGETGCGKGVLAHWLHRHGPRAEEAFVDLNCAGLSREFLETELFGHAKGAFTGAAQIKQGLLEIAHRGTVFLDEIGDMPQDVQPRLLKVLEEKHFRRMGEVAERSVDVRLIAATAQPLAALVGTGRFRSDLYYRLNSLPLMLPPLRERREDIVPLAEHLLEGLVREGRTGEMQLAEPARRALEQYAWPGNVRELRNCLERAILLCDGSTIDMQALHFAQTQATPEIVAAGADPDQYSLAEMERRHILRVLDQVGGQVDVAAQRLGMPRSTLYQRIKQYRSPAH